MGGRLPLLDPNKFIDFDELFPPITRSRDMTTKAKGWRDLASAAMAALTEDGDYPTTTAERIALVCMTIETMQTTTRASLTLANIAGRCPLSRRQVQAVCSRHLDEISANLGTNFTYEKSSYDASGRGAFGRSKGGSRARQHEARLVDH